MSRKKTLKHTLVFTVLTLLLAMVLTACGGSTAPTATSAPAATTAAAPTATSAPTATTAPAGANVKGTGLSFPNWKEITLEKEFIIALIKSAPSGVSDISGQMLVSDESDLTKASIDLNKIFRTYPKRPLARKAMKAQTKCSSAK